LMPEISSRPGKDATRPVSRSQTLISKMPPGAQVIHETGPKVRPREPTLLPLARSHTQTVPEAGPVARRRLSLEKASERMCPAGRSRMNTIRLRLFARHAGGGEGFQSEFIMIDALRTEEGERTPLGARV